MKFAKLVAAAATAVLFFAAQSAYAGIAGTKHDFTSTGATGAGKGLSTQICNVCHAPHNTSANGQLWNHTNSTASFTMYTSPSLTATGLTPGGVSKLCLSCHDGTVAIDAFGGATGTTSLTGTTGGLIGTDLSNDHPIGFTYDAALATNDGSLVTPASASLVVTGIPLYTTGKLECATCHDVHNNTAAPFLRVANTGSALCTKCHTK